MRCDEVLERILEAEPEELRGKFGSPLGEHIASCTRCGGVARRILEEESALGGHLISCTPVPALDDLLERAKVLETDSRAKDPRGRVWGRGRPSGLGEGSEGGSRKRWGARRWALAILPLAAAAATATLFIPSTRTLPGDPYVPPLTPPGLDLEVPEGRTAAVLETKDPDITVLWLF